MSGEHMTRETQTEVRRLVDQCDRCLDSAKSTPTAPWAPGLAALATAYYTRAQLVALIGSQTL